MNTDRASKELTLTQIMVLFPFFFHFLSTVSIRRGKVSTMSGRFFLHFGAKRFVPSQVLWAAHERKVEKLWQS